MAEDDDFEPKLGKIRARSGKRGGRYLQRVLRSAAFAGGRALSGLSRNRRFDGSRIGRGAGAGRVLRDRHAAFRARRVVIKTRIVKIGARGLKAATLHLRYIQRDGVTREGMPGELYDAAQDRADGKALLERSEADRHQFRFIVAAEDSVEYENLKGFTRVASWRAWSKTSERSSIGSRSITSTPVILIRTLFSVARTRTARISSSPGSTSLMVCARASEIVTLDLGPRTDLEIERKLTQEVDQDRLTNIDRRLIRDAADGGSIDIRYMRASMGVFSKRRAGRLQRLKSLGLSEEVSPGVWRLSKDLEATLQRMGERGDIIKTMHRAMTRARIERAPADYAIFDPLVQNVRLVGRVVERGLSDEVNDRHYHIVDGVDGRSHWVDIGSGEAIEQISPGTVVAIQAKPVEPKLADRIVADIAERHDGQYSPELHRQSDPAASGEYVAAHVRRLEALRRENVVERMADGSWQIPAGFLKVAEARERAQSRHAPVAVEALSTTRVEHQVRADGATWLDRELIGNEPSSIRDAGFGREVKAALAQRRRWLIERGLAEEGQGQIVYRSNLLAMLRRRELTRVAVQISGELNLLYTEFGNAKWIEGMYRRRLDLVSGRFAVIERARDFTLVPWRPVLDRNLGKTVSGILRGNTISWGLQRQRNPGSP